MKRNLLQTAAIALLSACTLSVVAMEQLTIEPDRADHLYQIGDPIQFTFRVADGDQPVTRRRIHWQAAREDGAPESGVVETGPDGSAAWTTALKKEGFLLLSGTLENAAASTASLCGVGAGVDRVRANAFRPDDFDRFWDDNCKELAATPMIELERVPYTRFDPQFEGKLYCFDVRIAAPGGVPVSGVLTLPVGAPAGSLPAVVTYLGAGVCPASPEYAYALKHAAVLCINAHGIPNDREPAYYEELNRKELANYFLSGRDDRDKYYFKYLFLRAARAVEYMQSLPEWDGKNLIVFGNSQGGAQALAAAALVPEVTRCVANVPWMCNFRAAEGGWLTPSWPGFVPPSGDPTHPAVLRTLPYYDMINFAPRIHAPTTVMVGLVDTVCYPSGVYSMFHALGSERKWLLPREHYGHGDQPIYEAAAKELCRILEHPDAD